MSSIADRLRALKKANYKETEPLTFPDGTQVILATLSAKEDRTLSDFILPYMGQAIGHYAKLETLAHSIKWFRGLDGEPTDLRDVDHIETGEVLENGTQVKQLKHVFLRAVIDTWNDVLVDTLFMRYAQLVEQMEQDVTKNIRVEMTDDVLLSKIDTKAEELRVLVEKAVSQNLKPKTTYEFEVSPLGDEGSDRLLKALKNSGTPVPPVAPPAPEPPKQTKAQAPPSRYDHPPGEQEEAPTRVRS